MEIGILGLASSGKSTLFRLLTDRQAEAAPGRRDQASLGMARVPDPRLDTLRELFSPKKFTPATVRYADVPGIPAEHGLENALNLPELIYS